ncbi:MAG: CotH kinase family protein [Ruminococcus sp.]|nr:CotH kinase family protein [Ruminococcus sp.]
MNSRFFKRAAAGILCLSTVLAASGLTPVSAGAAANPVSINEVCPKNTTSPAKDGNFYDWVELYNNSDSSVDISGYGLSDKESKPFRYTFPAGSVIPAKGSLVVYCDSDAALNDSSIAPFGMSATGETIILSDTNGTAVDTLTFEALASDTSYGQYPDGSGEFYTLKCTPGQSNAAPEGKNAVKLPEFSQESGFYDSGFSLSISVPEGYTVYYTTDGSDPTTESEKYTSPIEITDMSDTENRLSKRTDISAKGAEAPTKTIDKAAIIRAVAVDQSGVSSEVVTKTYFVGKTASGYYKDMKVVSLVTDPDNLFDYEKGIYVTGKIYDEKNGKTTNPQQPGQPGQPEQPGNPGGWNIPGFGDWGGGGWGGWDFVDPGKAEANYTQKGKEWERPANFEMFENGESVVKQNVGIRIKGAYSRSAVQKSFTVYARKDYGSPVLKYDFFEGTARKASNNKKVKEFENIVIRNGGNDVGNFYFRDTVNQQLIADRDMSVQGMSECILFIDGEFWGIYQLTEKVNDDYINTHYGIKKSDVAIVKNDELEEGSEQDLQDWQNLIKGVANGSISYEQFAEKVDMQSYMDYFAAQIYWCNSDWPQNNTAVWRSNAVDETNPYSDGKWRMFLFDTESGQGLYGSQNNAANADCFQRIRMNSDDFSKSFIKLLSNEKFSKEFARTFMDIANYNFDTTKTTALADKYKTNYEQQILDTYERFFSRSQSGENGRQKLESEYNTIVNFYKSRFNTAESTLKRAASLTGNLNNVTVENNNELGTVKFNTLNIKENSYSGKYHSDYELTASAQPVEGVTFDHWEITGTELTSGTEKSADISFKAAGDVKIKAVYSGSPADPKEPAETTTTAPAETATTTSSALAETTTTVTTTVSATPATKPVNGNVNYGDANEDGKTSVADAVAILQALSNKDKYGLSDQGKLNADVFNPGDGITGNDALTIQKYDAGLLKSLPEWGK